MKQAEALKPLYRLAGLAPLLTLTLYLSQFMFIRWGEYPASTQDWFALFQRSKLLGLFYINALGILSITLLGVMFLALFSALKAANPSWMTVGACFGLLGVGVFVVPRVASSRCCPWLNSMPPSPMRLHARACRRQARHWARWKPQPRKPSVFCS